MMMGQAKAMQFVLTIILLWRCTDAATTAAVKFCGRQLSEIINRVCDTYNTPSWNVPTVEQPGATARRKRELGIVDECCVIGCTWEQLSEYCIVPYPELPVEDMDSHNIADRSAEAGASGKLVQVPPAALGWPSVAGGASDTSVGSAERASSERAQRREVGGEEGRGRGGRKRKCWCRRKRRSGRRRQALMGNTELIKDVRAAPVVGTVSPLITWGRTLNTDLPTFDRDRYAYVVYA